MKEAIRRHREARGLTQGQLAKKMGYHSQSIVAMWESGDRKPPSDKLPLLPTCSAAGLRTCFRPASRSTDFTYVNIKKENAYRPLR